MDYISREVVIETIHRYFNEVLSLLPTQINGGYEVYLNTERVNALLAENKALCELIKALPAADVVEVIRCKDCKYFNLNKWGKVNDIPLIVAHEICDFWGNGCKTDKDAYCSFVERRG